jgi:2-polyprenyl-3-methyl-5-hydroxy-6-metoxy-1,4-benzoquinol methylase
VKNRFINTEPDEIERFDGHVIHARAGVHGELERLLRSAVPPPARVVDVGAGAGAFSVRLAAGGYDVTACDIDPSKWSAAPIAFYAVDATRGLASQLPAPFDAACCIEVIEHVENPWALFRELAAIVRPGGRLLLSTPNVTSFLSRLTFLRRGELHQFGEADLAYGHINPLTRSEIHLIARETGWRLVRERPCGYLPIVDLQRWTPRAVLFGFARFLAYVVSGPAKHGWCRAFIFERTDRSARATG